MRNPESGIRYRILFLKRDEAIVFDVDAPVGPKSIPPARRKESHKRGRTDSDNPRVKPAVPESRPLGVLVQWPKESWPVAIRDRDGLTDAEQKFYDRASAVVEFLHQDEPSIYYPKERAALIRAAIDKFHLTQRTIRKYLRSYWRAGKDTQALTSDLSNCGAAGKLRVPNSAKRGRPRSQWLQDRIGPGTNVQASDQHNIKKAAEWYRGNVKNTLEDAYLWMLGAYYSNSFANDDGTAAWGADPRVTINFQQFEYHCARYLNPFDNERRKAEKSRGSKKPRDRHVGAQTAALEVGTVAEIDALHTNISLVSSDRNFVIGGLVVFIVIEYVSALIIGFSVGWDGEPYESCADALVKCVTDKVEWCAQYGIGIEADEWPARHCPQHFHTDRGSAFMSQMADRIVEVMRPNRFTNTPPMSPESKGGVENTVRLVKNVFMAMYPGTWIGKVGSQNRGVPSPHKDAALTRNDFIRAFMNVVLDVNQKVRQTATSPQRVARGVPNSPVAIYNDALRTHRHRLRRLAPVRLEADLMTRMNASVSDEGIYLGYELYYLPDDVRHYQSAWFKKMAQDKTKVKLALNRETVDVAFLCRGGKEEGFISCSLSPRSAQFRGMSLREVQMNRTRQNELNTLEKHNRLSDRTERRASMQRDAKEAQAKTQKAVGYIPNSERDISNRREHRSNERAIERQKLQEDLRHRHGHVPSQAPPPTTDADSFDYPDIDDE